MILTLEQFLLERDVAFGKFRFGVILRGSDFPQEPEFSGLIGEVERILQRDFVGR
jgi:hypothetical protein